MEKSCRYCKNTEGVVEYADLSTDWWACVDRFKCCDRTLARIAHLEQQLKDLLGTEGRRLPFRIRRHTRHGNTEWWVVDGDGHNIGERVSNRDDVERELSRLQHQEAVNQGFGSDY